MARITKAQWINEAMSDPDKGAPCVAISLVHKQGTADVEVHTVQLNEKTRKLSPDSIANLLIGKAEGYAQDLPGAQLFSLLAFYGDSKEPGARHPFQVTGVTEYNGLATEAPDARGTTQQGMRLLEGLANGTFHQIGTVFKASGDLIDRMSLQNEKLMSDNRAMFGMVKDLMVRMAQQESDRRLEILKYERGNALREKFYELAPAAINGLAGNEIFPQAAADTALIKQLAKTFDPADPAGSLQKDPMLVGLLMQRMSEVLAEEKKKEAARAELAAAAARVPNELGEAEDSEPPLKLVQGEKGKG